MENFNIDIKKVLELLIKRIAILESKQVLTAGLLHAFLKNYHSSEYDLMTNALPSETELELRHLQLMIDELTVESDEMKVLLKELLG